MKNIAEESQLRKAGQSDLDAIKRVATSLLYEDVIVNAVSYTHLTLPTT